MSVNPERASLLNETHERLQTIGLSDPRVTIAAAAAIEGAREVLAIHGASPEVLKVEYKAKDGDTPKTVADTHSGTVIKRLIRDQFPEDRINEEESGDEKGTASEGNAWHVDPLDGTSSYAEGQRYSTVGIAVYSSKRPYAAVICHPFERELVVAVAGKGAFLYRLAGEKELEDLWGSPSGLKVEGLFMTTDCRQIEVSKAPTLVGGIAYIDALFNSKTRDSKFTFMAGLVDLAGNNLGFRMSGSNIDQQLKVAKGSARLTLTDAVGGFFDLAAGGLAIIEAGGKFTDVNGHSVNESTQVAIGTNGPMHDDVLELARVCYQGYQGFR
ncbi:hypothetical protein HYW43_00015 [Candidatus Daviesbacteria bacterium]|nr:hypothetical protein [Candidatus Daviesbacteria bacterium]